MKVVKPMTNSKWFYAIFYIFYVIYSAILIVNRLTPDTFNIGIQMLSSVQLVAGIFLLYNNLRGNYVNERKFLSFLIMLTIVNGALILEESSLFYGWTFYGAAMDLYRIVLVCGIACHRIYGLYHMRNYGKQLNEDREREIE
jgi:hypothetical protein